MPAEMSEARAAAETEYDRVLYGSEVVPLTAPEHLALRSLLLGGPRPPHVGFRLLEIGCAEGGNIIPLAVHHPESRFVGVDASAAQIAAARAAAEEVGAANLTLIHADLRGLLGGGLIDGEFDYIVAHGVFSWVPPAVRAALLGVCRERLAPDGIAYVSFNTQPGWALRGVARDLALKAAGSTGEGDPAQRAERSREAARALRAVIRGDDPWSQLLGVELDKLAGAGLGYLTHEYLSPDNDPLYLADFIAEARAAGLGWIGDAMNLRDGDATTRAAYEALEAQGLTGAELEQAADLVCRRAFRAALLCHPERIGAAPDDAALVDVLWVAAELDAPDGPADYAPGVVERFRGVAGVELGVGDPLCKAAFRVLRARYPDALRVTDLGAQAVRVLEAAGFSVEPAEPSFEGLVGDLRLLHERGQVELRLRSRAVRVDEVGAMPRVMPLSRLEARRGKHVTTPLHEQLPLDETGCAIVELLDGTRDVPALTGELVERAVRGEIDLGVAAGAGPLLASAALRRLNDVIERLATWGLLAATEIQLP